MEKHFIDMILLEVGNFDKLKEKYNYADVADLIAHYIEEEVITSQEELQEVIRYIKIELGIVIDPEVFK